MKIYKLLLTQASLVSGSFETIGTYENNVYVLGENLEAPFVEITELPSDFQERVNRKLTEAKARKLEALNASYESFVSQLTNLPQTEILTWSEQEAEARAYTASKQESDAPMLSSLSKARNIPLSMLCAKVLEKAEAYRSFIAYAIGKRQAYEDAIERAQTLGALESIHINFTPPQEAQETESQEILANTEVQG